jgi:hypothetical protein
MKTMATILTIFVIAAGFARGQASAWPRLVRDGGTEITVYQPQPDSLDGVTLQSRVAISVKRPENKNPTFGALWMVATLDIDRDSNLARVVSVKIDRTHLSDIPDKDAASLVQALESDARLWDFSIALNSLKAGLRSSLGESGADYRNDPPKIIVMSSPAVLVLLDGEPRLQDVSSTGLKQVVNTAFPVIFDPKSKQYWLYGSSVWFTTGDLLRSKWSWAATAPANIADLVKDTETLASEQSDSGKGATPAQLRSARIVMATEPTELIVTDGAPKYSPLVGGEILYVTNTDSDIFMEVATQRHFLVISGRWYAAPSLQGPWTFIAPENLPKGFADIPEDSTKAGDLAFVPGTDRAKDAVLDSMIPQTAEIFRKDAKIDVQYDGTPKFSAVPNTSLEYAENTPSEVIRSNGRYYACEEGVWYLASSPSGPWSVSDTRPAGVDAIPPTSPVYNTKFVYIYDSTPDFVHVGYLPGYRWSFPYRGVIIYGTGWRYRGWSGRYYYPRPATWGFYPRYNPWTGWTYGMSWNAGWLALTSHWGLAWAGWTPVYRPGFWYGFYGRGWFGPGGYRPPRPPHWHPPGRPAPGRAGGRPPVRPGRPGNNLYHMPRRPGVRPRPITRPDPRPVPRPGNGPRPAPQTPPGRPGRPGRGLGRPAPGTEPSRPPLPPGRSGGSGRGTGGPGRGSGAGPSRPPAPSGRASGSGPGRSTTRPTRPQGQLGRNGADRPRPGGDPIKPRSEPPY